MAVAAPFSGRSTKDEILKKFVFRTDSLLLHIIIRSIISVLASFFFFFSDFHESCCAARSVAAEPRASPLTHLCAQAWALFKGKFREGIDKPDPPTWKTRLRCALNKSNDFEELVERSQLDISDPYKVYRIVPEGAKKSECTHQYLDEST